MVVECSPRIHFETTYRSRCFPNVTDMKLEAKQIRARNTAKLVHPLAVSVAALSLTLGACSAANESAGTNDSDLSGTLNGAGASSQEAAIAAWTKEFQISNNNVTVNYDPIGSGSGRGQFLSGGISFAGTDAPLSEEELAKAKERCTDDVIELPVYVSPIAVVFNLNGLSELNFSAGTLGKIFAGDITKWNDPQIAEENPEASLPDLAITAVHRSDDSGTTENFTEYLAAASGGTWSKGAVDAWPYKSGEGAEGTSGVIAAVKTGEGTIGYADASQAEGLSVAKIKVGDSYVAYSPEAAANLLDDSTRLSDRGENSVVFELNRTTTAANTYPIALVSYQVACSKYDDSKEAELVKNWLRFVISKPGQTAAAVGAGSAPISDELSGSLEPIIESIS